MGSKSKASRLNTLIAAKIKRRKERKYIDAVDEEIDDQDLCYGMLPHHDHWAYNALEILARLIGLYICLVMTMISVDYSDDARATDIVLGYCMATNFIVTGAALVVRIVSLILNGICIFATFAAVSAILDATIPDDNDGLVRTLRVTIVPLLWLLIIEYWLHPFRSLYAVVRRETDKESPDDVIAKLRAGSDVEGGYLSWNDLDDRTLNAGNTSSMRSGQSVASAATTKTALSSGQSVKSAATTKTALSSGQSVKSAATGKTASTAIETKGEVVNPGELDQKLRSVSEPVSDSSLTAEATTKDVSLPNSPSSVLATSDSGLSSAEPKNNERPLSDTESVGSLSATSSTKLKNNGSPTVVPTGEASVA
jgi:hypothetical protein